MQTASIQPEVRTTAPPIHNPPIKKARNTDPIRIFVDKDRLARFWFLAAIIVLVASALDRIYLIQALKEREHVVIVDPAGTYFVSPLLDFQEARELHAQQSTLAAISFLERGPKGFDQPELLKRMFLKEAIAKAESEWFSEEAEFKAKQLHQKVEIAKIDFVETRTDAILTQVTGQLIRTGIFQDRVFSEAIPFALKLKMLRNPNMIENGRFPTAVADFKYEPTH